MAGKGSAELKIGLVAILGIALLIYGINFLKGSDILSKKRHYFALYTFVDGLTADNPVQISGYSVGKIERIRFSPDNSGNIIVEFFIEEEAMDLPKGTIARIVNLGLLGDKGLALELGPGPGFHKSGDELLSGNQESLQEGVERQILPLKKKAEDLILSIDSVMIVVQTVLNKNARQNLEQSFESIKRGIAVFEKTSMRIDTLVFEEKARIEEITRNVASITRNVQQNNNRLSNIIENVEVITDSLAVVDFASTMNNASEAMKDLSLIMEKINSGDGSLSLLLHDKKLYKNLEQSALELDKLLEDVRINPERYVRFSLFGKKEKSKDKPRKKPRPDTPSIEKDRNKEKP